MKIAILSDIHSNLEAMQACIRKANSLGVEQYVCLGDIIGYGADPVATLDLVMSLPGLVAVRGNHDEAALTGRYPGVNKSIQDAIRWTHERLTEVHLNFIRDLPYIHPTNGAVYAHASLYQPEKWPYLTYLEPIRKCIDMADQPLIFIGHTHLPRLYYENSQKMIQEVRPRESTAIPIYQQRRYLVNVGSVGQPRDGNTAASFVVHDTNKAEVTFYRVAYDFSETARKILEADLAPHFAERLGYQDEPNE